VFDEITSIEDLHLDYISTVLPPKKFFLPPKETLFIFDILNGKFTTKEIKVDEKSLILGIHPCDVHALLKLDKFFSGDFDDLYYQNRRKNTVIVALNCVEPSEYSFCYSMGTGPFLNEGYDILLTDTGTYYLPPCAIFRLECSSQIVVHARSRKNGADQKAQSSYSTKRGPAKYRMK